MVTPLLMLGVYTFVFGTVFKARWADAGSDASIAEFAVILFSGLTIYQVLAETMTRAPGLILANSSYVKKIVFPLHVLVPAALGTSLFHAGISLLILLPFQIYVFGGIPWTAAFVPIAILPYLAMALGLGWLLSSLGTYFRDIGQIMGPIVTAMLFLAPIFFPVTALPDWLQPWVALNPVSIPVESIRDLLIFGRIPPLQPLLAYMLVSLAICLGGFHWFEKTRKGFADII